MRSTPRTCRGTIDKHPGETSRQTTKFPATRMTRSRAFSLDLAGTPAGAKKGEQFYDEPIGKILRRLPDNLVEIDIGSADKAKNGLTFSILPADFPVKGYQSRVQVHRVPDDKNVFRRSAPLRREGDHRRDRLKSSARTRRRPDSTNGKRSATASS